MSDEVDMDALLAMVDGTDVSEDVLPVEVKTELPKPVEKPARKSLLAVPDDDPVDFMENSGFKRERVVPDICKPWMEEHEFKLVRTISEVNRIIDTAIERGACSLDLETEGLDNRIIYREDGRPETVHKIVGYCISYDGHTGYYIPVRHKPQDGEDLNVQPVDQVEAAIKRLCEAAIPVPDEAAKSEPAYDPLSYTKHAPPRVVIYFWNAQFDQEFLYPVTGIDWWHPASFEDGMLASFCIIAGDKALGLKGKSKQLLRDSRGNPYEMIELKELFYGRPKEIHFALLAPDEPGVIRYGGSDGVCTYLLCHRGKVKQRSLDIVDICYQKHAFTYRLEKQVSNMLRPMERNRVFVLRDKVREMLVEQEAIKVDLLAKIKNFALEQRQLNLDPNSPKQLSEFLFGDLPNGLDISPKPEKNAASGQFKTDSDSLEKLAKLPNAPSILKEVVRYREVEKFIGTYLNNLSNNPDSNDEIRVSFKQHGQSTGRFSAPAGNVDHGYSGVPVHGIPGGSEIRRAFAARKGYTYVKCDYAAEELRIAANVTGEKVWIDEFHHGTGDLHSITARAFFGKPEVSKEERNAGKIANFSLLYGGGPRAIIRATGCDELEARRRKQAFDKAVPMFAAWIKQQHKRVKEDLGVTTAFGRWLAIPEARDPDHKIAAACERHAVNYQIQGAGADILKISMVLLHKRFFKEGWLRNGGDDSVRILLCVHDEIVFEIRHDRVAQAIPIIVDIMESPWRMPKNKWQVPLVVEPLVGYNWKSGYKVERQKPNSELEFGEVVQNGFVYGTTRKPKLNKNDEPDESLDIGERLISVKGKPLFQVAEPPWIIGEQPAGEAQVLEMPTRVEKVESVDVPAAPVVAQTPKPVEPKGPSVTFAAAPPRPQVAPISPEKIVRVRLLSLTDRTIEQVGRIILDHTNNESGYDLHLTDALNETLIPPGQFRVDKDPFIEALIERHLISELD